MHCSIMDKLMTEEPVTEEPATEEPVTEELKENSYFGVGLDIFEAAFKLNWNAVPRDEFRASKTKYDPDISKDSEMISLKLVNSDKQKFIEAPLELLPVQTESEKEARIYIPGVKQVQQILYPKLSALMEGEQISLFHYLRKKLTFKQALSAHEESVFQVLMSKAQIDYPVFQEFVQLMWRQHHYERCYQIKPEVVHFIDSLWKKQSMHILNIYPPCFKLASNIPLTLNDPHQDHTEMRLVKCLAIRGKVPLKMKKPKLTSEYELITDGSTLSKIKPIMVEDSSKHVVLPIPPVSLDQNVDDLLLYEDIDVVITPSGIKTILDNTNISSEWILPFVIKNILKVNGTTKKVLFIDKKLPAHSMSLLNKAKWHAKMTAKWALLTAFHPAILGEDSERQIKTEKTEGSAEDDISDSFESFNVGKQKMENIQMCSGINNCEPRQIKTEKTEGSAEADISDSFESFSVGKQKMEDVQMGFDKKCEQRMANNDRTLKCYGDNIDFEEIEEFGVAADPIQNKVGQNPILRQIKTEDSYVKETKITVEQSAKKCKVSVTTIPTLPSSNEHNPNPSNRYLTRSKTTQPASAPILSTVIQSNPNQESGQKKKKKNRKISHRLLYNHWCLRKSTHYRMSKREQRTLNLLVRTRQDGLLCHSDPINGKWNNFIDEVYVSSKLEFQPEYGVSEMDAGSTVREYVDLCLRPTSKLVRVRSVGHTQEVMLMEVKSMKELQALMPDPRRTFDSLYAVLTSLIDLAPGQYMLQHTSRGGAFAQAYVQHPCGSDLNLEQLYETLRPVEINAPPSTMDLCVFTRLHQHIQRPPGVLTPLPPKRTSILSKPSRNDYNLKRLKKVKKRIRRNINKNARTKPNNKTKQQTTKTNKTKQKLK